MQTGGGVMAVWNDLEPGHEAEFDRWYCRQHIPERLSQPGFREARRYLSDGPSPRYCAFYRLDGIDALATPQYLERLAHPTRWTQRAMPWFRDMARTPCTVTLDRGHGVGGMMRWLGAFGHPGDEQELRSLLGKCFDAAIQDPGIVRLQLWECDRHSLDLANPEARLRATPDRIADWIVCIESASAAVLEAGTSRVRAAMDSIRAAARLIVSPQYRLTWLAHADGVPPPLSDQDAGL